MSLLSVASKSNAAQLPAKLFRTLATETTSTNPDLPPPLPPKRPQPPRSNLYPRPRPVSTDYTHHRFLPNLPPTFGRNQLLPVSNTTRALLESIVAQFNAPIRYAFAYGSGVFEQDGYPTDNGEEPMLDFMFAVTHPDHFHSINMHQYASHYPLSARLFGSDYVAKVQSLSPGVWFNTYVPMGGVTIKYGVTTVDNLCSDLLNWRTLYLAGRMHKPLRIIKDDARVRLTQQVNLTSAVRAALLMLPEAFPEEDLFRCIAAISYTGDPRMVLPAENRSKVDNIVKKQAPQFKELYHRLVVGLPGVHWASWSSTVRQDTSPISRAAHLRKLPSNLLAGVKNNYTRSSAFPNLESDESAYWVKLAGDENLPRVLREEMTRIVRYPATVQTAKGLLSAGLGKSVRYTSSKISKWWHSDKPSADQPKK
ncbi:Mmp37-domain-containing protein [Fistulina hepatica ATCC 64428]|uniref:Phosphatidate cytidylyltransferase, mitochondrial n=1 Tax=Fistulina hepatica ATCC 64428 TaxID=1128425 RepID=A0A0D7ACR6_9AGAR|nr:Mmp37-domain-containing protein [Fistulina hepatica ATCC 64428]